MTDFRFVLLFGVEGGFGERADVNKDAAVFNVEFELAATGVVAVTPPFFNLEATSVVKTDPEPENKNMLLAILLTRYAEAALFKTCVTNKMIWRGGAVKSDE